jgi:hypothetical protein
VRRMDVTARLYAANVNCGRRGSYSPVLPIDATTD